MVPKQGRHELSGWFLWLEINMTTLHRLHTADHVTVSAEKYADYTTLEQRQHETTLKNNTKQVSSLDVLNTLQCQEAHDTLMDEIVETTVL